MVRIIRMGDLEVSTRTEIEAAVTPQVSYKDFKRKEKKGGKKSSSKRKWNQYGWNK